MERKSRTYYTLKNARISLLFFFLQIIVGFYSRKIFLDFLGAELIGMNTTLANVLSFINLAEMGIGVAMSAALYRPLFNQDRQTINEMLSVQGYWYRKIAYLFLIVSIPLCCSFPFIFSDITFPLWYVYVTYIVCIGGIVSNYVWNYREILIGADQKNYKLFPYVRGGRLIKILIQIFLILYVETGYFWYLMVDFAYNCAMVLVINHVIRREYPWLDISIKRGKAVLPKYKQLTTLTKQVFFHKVSSFVLYETAPLIIFMYVSLSMVTYYGNYTMLVGYTISLVETIFTGMGASIGNLVAEGNKPHIMKVYWELFTSRMWIATVTVFALYVFIPPFITVWLGKEYVLSNTTLILILFSLFVRISRAATESFKEAYKLFGDIAAPIVEAGVNLSCSLVLGYYWGLNGILIGANISLVLVVLMWKPYYLYKHGFKLPFSGYVRTYGLHLLVLALSWAVVVYAGAYVVTDSANTYFSICLHTAMRTSLFAVLSFGTLYILTPGMRQFAMRLLRITKLKY